jgi:hypothetical protein
MSPLGVVILPFVELLVFTERDERQKRRRRARTREGLRA